MRPDIVSRDKSSSHPLRPGRFYSGVVKSVDARGAVNVYVNELGSSYDKIIPIGTNPSNHMSVGDVVKCTFTDEYFTEMIVLGSAQIKNSFYPTVAQYNALLAIVNDLVERIEALEGA